jgi:hypothetical protein
VQYEIADLLYLGAMAEHPTPVFRTIEDVLLIGTMAIYDSQAQASERIPDQWREFRFSHPALDSSLGVLRRVALHWRPEDPLPHRRCTKSRGWFHQW